MGFELNWSLQEFDKFLGTKGSGSQVAQLYGKGIGAASMTASWGARHAKRRTQNAQDAININNAVRTELLGALKAQFKANSFAALPTKVKAALKGTYAMTAEGDFAADAKGNVNTGKPLTRRRIAAVMNAVHATLNKGAAAELKRVMERSLGVFMTFYKKKEFAEANFRTKSSGNLYQDAAKMFEDKKIGALINAFLTNSNWTVGNLHDNLQKIFPAPDHKFQDAFEEFFSVLEPTLEKSKQDYFS